MARQFLASQAPDLDTLRKSNSHEGKALRAYEAQRPVGARAFAKIQPGDWLEVRRPDGPNAWMFVTHVGGMKRSPAVLATVCRQERAVYATPQRVRLGSVVAIHARHPNPIKGTPYALLSVAAKVFQTRTCAAQRDPNAGTYFELVMGDARGWTQAMAHAAVAMALSSAGFRNVVRARHPKTGALQWYAKGKDYNARVRLCGTVSTASIEIDFALHHRAKFRRK